MSEAKYWEEREAAKAKALKLAAKAEAAQREDYAKALKREKDREYQRRKAKQGRSRLQCFPSINILNPLTMKMISSAHGLMTMAKGGTES